MSIDILFFASLKERMGKAGDQIEAGTASTVREVWARINPDEAMPVNTLCSVNMEYVDPDHAVEDGDEVAFFPPVTGG